MYVRVNCHHTVGWLTYEIPENNSLHLKDPDRVYITYVAMART